MQIKLNVSEHLLTLAGTSMLAGGSENVDTIKVTFDSTWNGFGKLAVFNTEKTDSTNVAIGTDGIATIPSLKSKKYLRIGIVGIMNEQTYTTNVIKVYVEDGAVKSESEAPAADVYHQILSMFGEMTTTLSNIIDDSAPASTRTYSSNKIEKLTTNLNRATLIVEGKTTYGGGFRLYSMGSLLIVENIAGTLATSPIEATLFTYSDKYPAVASDQTQKVGAGISITLTANRELKYSFSSGSVESGMELFFADSVAEDTQINELANKVSAIQSDFSNYNAINYLENIKNAEETKAGLTFNATSDTVSVSGTSTSTAVFKIFDSNTSFVDGIKPGETYRVCVKNSTKYVSFQLLSYAGSELTTLVDSVMDIDKKVTIPDSATGLLLRLRCPGGKTVSGNVSYYISKVLSNANLSDRADETDEEIFKMSQKIQQTERDLGAEKTFNPEFKLGRISGDAIVDSFTNCYTSNFYHMQTGDVVTVEDGWNIRINRYDKDYKYLGSVTFKKEKTFENPGLYRFEIYDDAGSDLSGREKELSELVEIHQIETGLAKEIALIADSKEVDISDLLSGIEGEDVTETIQRYLNLYNTVYIAKEGIHSITGLKLKSNNTLIATSKATFKLLPGTHKHLLENSDFENGNENISIIGGNWDNNSENDNGAVGDFNKNEYCGFGMCFTNVNNLNIKGVHCMNSAKYAISVNNCKNIKAEDISFYTYSDGIHFQPPCSNVFVNNISGATDDDLVSFTCGDYDQFEAVSNDGNFENIIVTNVDGSRIGEISKKTARAVLFCGAGASGSSIYKNIFVKNVIGMINCKFTDSSDAYITTDHLSKFFIYDAIFDNVEKVYMWPTNSDNVVIQNCRNDNFDEAPLIRVTGYKNKLGYINHLKLKNISYSGKGRVLDIAYYAKASNISIEDIYANVDFSTSDTNDAIFSITNNIKSNINVSNVSCSIEKGTNSIITALIRTAKASSIKHDVTISNITLSADSLINTFNPLSALINNVRSNEYYSVFFEEAANTSEHSDVFISNSNINATLKFTGNCNCSLSSNSAFITNELSALSPSVYNTINKNNHRYMYDGTEWIKVV